jgi:DNA-binding FrmR family transcriptional regulator
MALKNFIGVLSGYPLGYANVIAKANVKDAILQIPDSELQSVQRRLKRAQGQLGGIIRMLEDGRDCTDVLTQLAAAQSAINRAGFSLIASGIASCAQDESGNADRAALERAFMSLS